MVPLVSVGITTYRRPQLLLETITSVLRQTLQDFEIVICDDNSRDNTAEVVRRVGDSRIRYHCNQVNLGQCKNINRCIQLSIGKYFCWNSDDNVYLPHFLEALVGALEAHPEVGLAACSTIVTDSALRPYHVQSIATRVTIEPGRVALLNFLGDLGYFDYNPSSVVYRRELLIQNGLLNESIWDDCAWLGRYVYRYGCIRIPDVLFCYRDHSQNQGKIIKQMDRNLDPIQVWFTQYEDIFKDVPRSDKELWALRGKLYRQLGRLGILTSIKNVFRGRFRLARKQILEALEAHPFVLIDPLMIATVRRWLQVRREGVRLVQAKRAAASKRPVLTL